MWQGDAILYSFILQKQHFRYVLCKLHLAVMFVVPIALLTLNCCNAALPISLLILLNYMNSQLTTLLPSVSLTTHPRNSCWGIFMRLQALGTKCEVTTSGARAVEAS